MEFRIKTKKPVEIERELSSEKEKYKDGYIPKGIFGKLLIKSGMTPSKIGFAVFCDYKKENENTFKFIFSFTMEKKFKDKVLKMLRENLKETDKNVEVELI